MNEQIKRVLLWAFGIPISLAVCTTIVLLLMRLEGVMLYLGIVALFLLGITVFIVNMLRSRKNEKLVASLLDILHKQADPDTFIKESEAAIQKKRNKSLRGTLSLNLAIGYEAVGDYGKAISVMKDCYGLMTDSISKAMFYINIASFYAQKGAVNEGLEAYQLGRPYVEKKQKFIPKAYILLVRGLLFYAQEKYEDALDSFRKVEPGQFEDRHAHTKLQLYMARTYARMGNMKEARTLYGKVCQRKTYPFLLECARREMEALSEKQ